VPLFVEELTAMLVDDGQLVAAADGGWPLTFVTSSTSDRWSARPSTLTR
jgi:hypothetical protein